MKTIKLTRGLEAMVDDEDFDRLNQYKWNAHKDHNNPNDAYYAQRNYRELGKMITQIMHREIANAPRGMQVDHIDGNGLNNCKSNLRIVNNRQNQQNQRKKKGSGYTGAGWDKKLNKWRAHIRINGKLKHLGYYNDELGAHNAYLTALEELNETYVDEIKAVGFFSRGMK
ncbi:MAG: HNH endonuclease [Acidaminococcaceae bacterium]|nr:HNH endonuclease [Acidaminococcaceae bacterium]